MLINLSKMDEQKKESEQISEHRPLKQRVCVHPWVTHPHRETELEVICHLKSVTYGTCLGLHSVANGTGQHRCNIR